MPQMTLEELLARAKSIPGFDDDARQMAPARELSRDSRFQDIADEQKRFETSPYNPAKGMMNPSNPELLGGNPMLNKAIDAATMTRDMLRMPNTPWWMPSPSTVGEGEILGAGLGYVGKAIGKVAEPIMGGIRKVAGKVGDMFGGEAMSPISGSEARTSFSRAPGEAGTFHGAQPRVNDKPIVSPDAGYGFGQTITKDLGKRLDKMPTAGSNELAGIDEAIASQEKQAAKSRSMNAKNGPGNVNDVRDYTSNPEPDDADDLIRNLIGEVKAGKRDIGGKPGISSDETTGSLFREHNPNQPMPNTPKGVEVPKSFGLQSPMDALASHESGDVLSLPRSRYTQGMGRGFERGGIEQAANRFDSGAGELGGPLVSSHGAMAGISSKSEMPASVRTMEDMNKKYGSYATKGNGGEGGYSPSQEHVEDTLDRILATGSGKIKKGGVIRDFSPSSAISAGDEASKRSVMFGGVGVGDKYPRGPRTAQSFFDKVKKASPKKGK